MARKSFLGWVRTLVLAGALAMGTNSAGAQYQYCVEHSALVAHLSENFQERQFAFGLIGQVAIMEVFVGQSGTWTIFRHRRTRHELHHRGRQELGKRGRAGRS
jgi:hypothetical protein